MTNWINQNDQPDQTTSQQQYDYLEYLNNFDLSLYDLYRCEVVGDIPELFYSIIRNFELLWGVLEFSSEDLEGDFLNDFDSRLSNVEECFSSMSSLNYDDDIEEKIRNSKSSVETIKNSFYEYFDVGSTTHDNQ